MCKLNHNLFRENCPSCKDLQKHWYSQLSDTGFIDIETKKDWRTDFGFELTDETISTGQNVFEARYSYYQWCEEKLNQNKFQSDKDKYIWECHTEGLTTREIAPRLGFKQSWISKRITYMRSYLTEHSIGSGVEQLDLLFWSEPWTFIKRIA